MEGKYFRSCMPSFLSLDILGSSLSFLHSPYIYDSCRFFPGNIVWPPTPHCLFPQLRLVNSPCRYGCSSLGQGCPPVLNLLSWQPLRFSARIPSARSVVGIHHSIHIKALRAAPSQWLSMVGIPGLGHSNLTSGLCSLETLLI